MPRHRESREGLQIITDGDAISTDAIAAAIVGVAGAWYQPRDFLFKWIRWTGKVTFKPWPLTPRNRKVAVIGRSDGYLSVDTARLLQRLGVTHIFATNADPVPGLVTPMPLGLTNFTNESPRHRVFGDNSHFTVAYERVPQRPDFDGSIYCNMTLKNAPAPRQLALDAVRGLEGLIVVQPEFTTTARVDYLASLRRFNFVLSPEGNGVDTHRTWETLYMGGIPVVLSHPMMNELLAELPAVILEDWRQLRDRTFLRDEWERITNHSWDLSCLRTSAWAKKIAEKSAQFGIKELGQSA